MEKKTFNSLVNECKDNTCSTCGAKRNCDRLEAAGLKTPFTKHFATLSPEMQEAISKVKEV